MVLLAVQFLIQPVFCLLHLNALGDIKFLFVVELILNTPFGQFTRYFEPQFLPIQTDYGRCLWDFSVPAVGKWPVQTKTSETHFSKPA